MDNKERCIIMGPSFLSMLTIAFIILKLVGVIAWPWVWVIAPLWIPLAAITAIYIVALIIVLCITPRDK